MLGGTESPSQPINLAHVAPFRLGAIEVHPGTRQVVRGDSRETLEPRVMQVLVALAQANGGVITRDELIERCWNGVVVGDNAINRVISRLRQLASGLARDSFELETITKVGYRMLVEGTPLEQSLAPASRAPRMTRRAAIGAGGGLLLLTAGAGVWYLAMPRRDTRVVALIDRGRMAMRDQMPDGTQQGIAFFEEALRLAPDDAEAWGNLALAWRNVSEYAPLEEISAAVGASENAARQALALDPDQPEAHAALALLPPIYGDWLAAERRMRAIHTRFPGQAAVIGELALLMFSVGRAADAAAFSQQATALEPLSPIYRYRLTYHLWTTDRLDDAERTVDRAMQLWPTHPAVWFARFLLFVGTDRYEAALRLLSAPTAEAMLGSTLDLWRKCCLAKTNGRAADRDAAVAASIDAARGSGSGCVNAILALNRLGAVDEAFAVAEGYLLRRGPLVTDIGSELATINDQRWRKTMMLFIPATSAMRSDPRFEGLCADIGLADYWRRSGTEPYFRARLPG